MTYWRWVSVRPLSWSQLPWILDDILKVGLCHRTDDILKVTACHPASYSGQYWWQGWLPYKKGALIASNRQLQLPRHLLWQSRMTNCTSQQVDNLRQVLVLSHHPSLPSFLAIMRSWVRRETSA